MECDTHKYVWEIGKDLVFFFSKSIQNAIKVEVVCLEFFYNNNIKACPLWGRKIEMEHFRHKKCLSRGNSMEQTNFILKTTLATVADGFQN